MEQALSLATLFLGPWDRKHEKSPWDPTDKSEEELTALFLALLAGSAKLIHKHKSHEVQPTEISLDYGISQTQRYHLSSQIEFYLHICFRVIVKQSPFMDHGWTSSLLTKNDDCHGFKDQCPPLDLAYPLITIVMDHGPFFEGPYLAVSQIGGISVPQTAH